MQNFGCFCPFFCFLSIYFLSFYVTVPVRSAIGSWAENAEMRFRSKDKKFQLGLWNQRWRQTTRSVRATREYVVSFYRMPVLLSITSAKWQSLCHELYMDCKNKTRSASVNGLSWRPLGRTGPWACCWAEECNWCSLTEWTLQRWGSACSERIILNLICSSMVG